MRAMRELILVVAIVAVVALAIRQGTRSPQEAPTQPSVPSATTSDAAGIAPDCAHAVELQRGRRWREAIVAYTACLRQTPDDAQIFFSRAACYTALEDHGAAIADYRASADRDGSGPEVWNNLAWELCEVGEYQKGLKAVDRGLALDHSGSSTPRAARLDTRAYALVGLRRYPEALQAIDEGLRIAPDSPFLKARREQVQTLMAGGAAPHPRSAQLKQRIQRTMSGDRQY